MVLPTKTLLTLLPLILSAAAQSSGTGKTTRYWDCCKASCSWSKKLTLASGAVPVKSCDAHDSPLTSPDVKSGCDGGTSYMCSNQSPWAVSETLAYGFAATTISGGTEASWCCACYELTFTSGPVAGKKLVVQATNTGGDLGSNQFDLAIPGGGFGIFNGCTAEWGTPSTGWGAQYGGVSSRSQCDAFPAALKAGCYFRYDWFMNADNPAVTFKQVTCPAAITAKSGCVRANDAINEVPTGAASVPTWTSGASQPTSPASSSSVVKPVSSSTSVVKPVSSSTTSAAGSATSSPATGGATAPHYGQCGGIGWAGATICEAGFTCKASGDYYSQCL